MSNWPGIVAVLGVVLIVMGLGWSHVADPANDLSEEQAKAYYEASLAVQKAAAQQAANMNRPANSYTGTVPDKNPAAELESARQRFDQAKEEVEAVRGRPATIAFMMQVIGGILAVIGIGGLFARRTA